MAGNCVSKGNFRRTKNCPHTNHSKIVKVRHTNIFSQETYMIHANCLAQTKEYT